MTPNTFVHDRLRTALAPLTDRTWLVLGLALMPVPLTSAFFIVQRLVPGASLDFSGLPVAYLVYGLANLLTVGVLYAILSPQERTAVFRFERPSIGELGSAVLAFPVGIGVYIVTSRVSGILGYELQGLDYTLADPVTIAMVVVGAVILAPITEEILPGSRSRDASLTWCRCRYRRRRDDCPVCGDSPAELRGRRDAVYLC